MSTPRLGLFTVALVDLDGTIVESAPGITNTLAFVLTEMGLPVPPPAKLLEFVGPPILDGLRDVAGLDPAQSREVLRRYRTRYRAVGAFDATPYDGVREALATLRERGLPLAVATSKPETQARRILAHFGLDDLFTVIAGASEDETRSTKADVVAWCLGLLAPLRVDLTAPVMIGDRIHDVEGAAAHGIPTIAAAWGYGSPAETAGAIAVAEHPSDLPVLLEGSPAGRPSRVRRDSLGTG